MEDRNEITEDLNLITETESMVDSLIEKYIDLTKKD